MNNLKFRVWNSYRRDVSADARSDGGLMMQNKIWHSNIDTPNEETRIYVKQKNGEIFLGWFDCRYLGNYEIQTLDYSLDFCVDVNDIEMWAYLDDLESIGR